MQRILNILILIMCVVSTASAAKPSAQESVDKMTVKLKKAQSIEFVFNIAQDRSNSTGRLVVGGTKFFLTTPEMKIWFDGVSQWSYLKSAGEVNLSRPNRYELAQANPLSILASLNGKNFIFRRLSSTEGTDKIEIIPKNPTQDFAKAVVLINSTTSMPKELTVYDAKGNSAIVKITSAKIGAQLPVSTFRFNPRQFPRVEVVDLR